MAGKMLKSLPYEKSLSKLSDRSEKSTAHPTAHTPWEGAKHRVCTHFKMHKALSSRMHLLFEF